MKPKVLVVDDDPSMLTLIQRALCDEGYEVLTASSSAAARAVVANDAVNLCLIDLTLPDDNGINLVREFRAVSSVGIIILTGKAEETDQVVGLEVGADDYIIKPFSIRELRARVNAVYRRSKNQTLPATLGGNAAARRTRDAAPDFQFGTHSCFISARRMLDADGQIIALTAMEFDTLVVFLNNPDRVLTRDQIMSAVRGQDWASYDRSIDGLVSRLRSKLEGGVDGSVSRIATVFGVGYCYRPNPA